MLFSEDLEKVLLFSLVLLLFGGIIFWGQPSTRATITIPCKYMSEDINFGGRVVAICHYEYTPSSEGTESFVLQLPGTSDIRQAYIEFSDVSIPTKTVNIEGSLPPETTTTHLVEVPDDAYNINIYGEIIGKGVDSDYPDQPYIKGGTKDLICGLDCKYAKDTIITSPGSFTLEVFSGYNGAGIDYRIYGSYNLPYPSVNVSINDQPIYSTEALSHEDRVEFADKISGKYNVIYLHIDGQPNFKFVIHTEQYCQVIGTDWSCTFVKNKYGKGTVALCSRKVKSTCDFNGIRIHIPLTDLKYKESATGPLKVSIASQELEVDPQSPELVLTSLPEGEYVLTVTYNLPYIVPEAVEAAGVCAIDKYRITFVGPPGSEGTASFTIYNIGEDDILVRIEPSDELKGFVTIIPSEATIPSHSSYTFTVKAKLPDYPTVIKSDIHIYGCAQKLVGLTVELNTKGGLTSMLPKEILSAIGAVAVFLLLLLLSKSLSKILGKKVMILLLIALPLLIFSTIQLLL